MILRQERDHNAGMVMLLNWYSCDNCGKEMFEGDPRYDDGEDLCVDCAFLLNKIGVDQYKKCCHYMPDHFKVDKFEGKIYWWNSKKAPWEKKDKDYRATPQYRNWRTMVFTRDNYTCQVCKTVGGKLEAHHIQKFHEFPLLRYDVKNGKTLCRPCHISEHRGVKA